MADVTLSADGVSVGDTLTTVIVHPNLEDGREPAAKYGERTVFISGPEDWEPDKGDVVEARVANIKEKNMRCVLVDD